MRIVLQRVARARVTVAGEEVGAIGRGVLALVGVVMVLSASSVVALHREGSSWFYFTRQLIGLCLGAALFVATVRVDYRGRPADLSYRGRTPWMRNFTSSSAPSPE